ncbi:transport and Golgi organization 2 homolog [Artemia franciscana]|nr:hypothetical protein QYM36_012160 [Artemia franciscana]KAK2710894.1 hypothetical protein QYM36_012160 [Artemia franciscana]KAK2710895.1 hypothetical protein QYM36_012160 [Artemia franciscana]KAK2710896.1 hypothetical protein QYM36_012160 [Artemia franciscana]
MCIVFFSAGSKAKQHGYRLILVSNRDEFYSRKTAISSWNEIHKLEVTGRCLQMISGTDQQEGKEGGTWLGMTKQGRIGILLNVFQGNKKLQEGSCNVGGRGFIISDFLKWNGSPESFLMQLNEEKDSYQPFHLVTISLSKNEEKVHHYCNTPDYQPQELKSEIIGVGNHLPNKSWKKVEAGKAALDDVILKNYPKELLVEKLFEVVSSNERHFPDHELESQGLLVEESILQGISSIFVKLDNIQYGTRTQTVILIDENDEVTFVERTFDCTEKFSALDDAKVTMVQHQFKLNI